MKIDVSLGEALYVTVTIADTSGANLSADAMSYALAEQGQPVNGLNWKNFDVAPSGTTEVIAKFLVSNTTPPGVYDVWVRVVDNPETVMDIAGTVTVV